MWTITDQAMAANSVAQVSARPVTGCVGICHSYFSPPTYIFSFSEPMYSQSQDL